MFNSIMRSPARALMAALLVLVFTGCTYDAELKKDFYKPTPRSGSAAEKRALRVAIVKHEQLKEQRFTETDGFFSVDIKTGASIAETVRREFAALFSEVQVIEDAAGGDYDLYAYPMLKWRTTYANRNLGSFRYKTQFTVKFKDRRRIHTVASYKDTRSIAYSPPASAFVTQIIQAASLYILSPITVPITTNAIGTEAEMQLHSMIGKSVKSIGNQVAADDARFNEYQLGMKEDGAGNSDLAPSVRTARRDTRYRDAPSKYDDFLNGVVVIRANDGTGTGFFVTSDGYLVTNQHVVGKEKYASVKLRNGRVLVAEVIESYPARDLALLKAKGRNFTWLQLSSGEDAGIGNDVLAIGTPRGLSWSVSKGIISAVRRSRNRRVIQTDAAVNTGNSGGPLIDLKSGRVVGVNTFILRKDDAEGLNFAVSSQDVLRTFRRYLANQRQ